jgi:hypothetical protein
MVKNDPLNFRIPSEEELGLKPLDLHIDPVPSLEELGIELDLDFDWRKDDKKNNSPVDGAKP